MKRHGIINSEIASVISKLGHTDSIVICDVGFPIPDECKRIDLALKKSYPSFIDVVAEVSNDMYIESVVLAEEIKENNVPIYQYVMSLYKDYPIEYVSHSVFKQESHYAKAIIRTGEVSPYANIILKAGVCF